MSMHGFNHFRLLIGHEPEGGIRLEAPPAHEVAEEWENGVV
jgi:hypothetical protein